MTREGYNFLASVSRPPRGEIKKKSPRTCNRSCRDTLLQMVRLLLITLGVCALLHGAETWRPTITAVNWAVASGTPETAMAAAQILARGGNAIDAAVAASFAASVVQPANTGIGGHAMVMIYRAGTGQVSCIDGSGW